MDPQKVIQARRDSVDERIDELRSELAALEQERAELDIAERVFDKLMPVICGPHGTADGTAADGGWTALVQAKTFLPGAGTPSFAQQIRDIILQAGRPMTRTELAVALADLGVPLSGKDPAKALTTRLGRLGPEVFVYFDPQGWWPADVPCPAMNYPPITPPDTDEPLI
jgi:hypothetical protein